MVHQNKHHFPFRNFEFISLKGINGSALCIKYKF